jgi:hypothetical protein
MLPSGTNTYAARNGFFSFFPDYGSGENIIVTKRLRSWSFSQYLAADCTLQWRGPSPILTEWSGLAAHSAIKNDKFIVRRERVSVFYNINLT